MATTRRATQRKRTTKRRTKKSSGKLTLEQKMKKAESLVSPVGEELENLKFLIYGRNGKGKTTFGASGEDVLIIDCNDRGTSSARKKKAHKFTVEKWEDIDLAFWYCKAGDGKDKFKTIVIDNVSSLATLCMKFVLGDEASRDPTLDPDMPDKRHWFKVTELMKTVIINFRNLEKTVVFLAQERRGYSEDDDEAPEIFPDLSASARATLQNAVTIIGWVHTKGVRVKDPKNPKKSRIKTQYRMLLGPHDTYITKVNIQDHGLPRVMVNPTIPKIMKIINRKED